ncbi:protein FAR1-RELATED SEQUENCE 5-like [Lactuca sativa]|uniref:protein FAR1-RELATED SEQUENCE 5-like n=1 Tax=Lactuca sativa TaxID=4236 RepID=UPI0022AF0EE8|nr:protein FAR1-RELATED SEQUENCE 5-like [Lactuca sativa]
MSEAEATTSERETINNIGDEDDFNDVNDVNDERILGKVFDTPDDTCTFYNDYSIWHGFSIHRDDTIKNPKTNEHFRKIYVYNKEGRFKWMDKNASSENEKKRRRDVRTGCQAKLRITRQEDGKWLMDSLNDTHNHDLTMTHTKVMKHRSHSNFHRSIEGKSLMVQFGQEGLKPSQIKKAVNTMKTANVADVTSKQCADVLSKHQKQHRGKEFYGLIKHFQDKTLVDSDQYFVMDLSDDGYPRNIFWADGRSRDAYTKFRDVVVFDVTYMTNKFKMPFAPFTGVNHHGQFILFGGALLENEKEETFKWLFEHFLKCMFGKYPQTIITDQDKAMGNAIKKGVSEDSTSDTIEQIEATWEVMCTKYELESNCWISDMYNQRIHWAKPFLNDTFFAGMTTTRRSESINSFFDGFVNSRTMLNEFVEQYDKVVESRRAAEEDENFKTMNLRPVLSSVHPIEAKAGQCYSRKMLDTFKK